MTRAQPATRASPLSTPWPTGPRLVAPEGQGEQYAERDQADGPQIPGLDLPEAGLRCRLRAGGRLVLAGGGLGGGAAPGTRRGRVCASGHHSGAEITG